MINEASPYTRNWLEGDALKVAPLLLGCELISIAGGMETAGRIVEIEAYHGTEDPASHAFRGHTPRTAPMFEVGGGVYVYLSYGIHTCLNIVTGPAGQAQAVLVRALEPTRGLDIMAKRRGTADPKRLATGPGNLAKALGITLALSGTRLGQVLSLQPPGSPLDATLIAAGPRVGISQAKEQPWRFTIRGNPFVSRPQI